MIHRRGCTALLSAVAAVFLASDLAAEDRAYAAARGMLQQAVTPQRSGSHLSLLFAIRQLNEPSTARLFERLLDHPEWQVQVHSVLGLAETTAERRIDPQVLTRVSPLAREAAVASALDQGLLHPEQLSGFVVAAGLEGMAELLVLAELVSLDEPVELGRLIELASSSDERTASLAACLAAARGEMGPLDRLVVRIAEAPEPDRQRRLAWLFETVRQYRLEPLLPWVRQMLDLAWLNEQTRRAGVFAAMTLDPVGSIDLWRSAVTPELPLRDRVDLALMLLAAGPDVPADSFDALAGDAELLANIIAAGKARAIGRGLTQALIDLIEFGHAASSELALTIARDLPESEEERIYLSMLDRMEREGPGRSERHALAIRAAARLFELNPEAVKARLQSAEPGSAAQHLLLLSLFESRLPLAGEFAASVPRAGFGRTDSLVLILRAKHESRLAAEDLRHLGVIVTGGGRVSELVRIQAAWLYLRHAARLDDALDSLDIPTRAGSPG